MDEFFNNYWPENDYRYYLQHHGIQGQKWGQRNAEKKIYNKAYK